MMCGCCIFRGAGIQKSVCVCVCACVRSRVCQERVVRLTLLEGYYTEFLSNPSLSTACRQVSNCLTHALRKP